MKKIFISFFLILPAIFVFSGCEKEKDFITTMKAGAQNSVGFGISNINKVFLDIAPSNGSVLDTAVNVYLSADQTYSSDIKVTLAVTPQLVNDYNTANGASYIPMPDTAFTLPLTVTIPANTKQGTAKLSLDINKLLSVGLQFGLGLTITKVEGGPNTIQADHNSFLLTANVRNNYDGKYLVSGHTLRAGDDAKTGNFSGVSYNLITTGGNTVDFSSLQVWADGSGVGIGIPTLTVNPTGTTYPVTISSSGGAYNDPNYNSRYDPASKTFYISFTWGAGPTKRLATDTLVYVGPR